MQNLQVTPANNIRTAAFVEGSGPPIVMLHGMAATSDIWRYTFNFLQDSFHVIAPDMPGHGRSEGAALPYNLNFYTEWLDALLEGLSVDEPVTIFGNSMGGAVGLAYTLQRSERVNKLVMVDALGLGPDLPTSGIRHVLRNLHNFIGLLVTQKIDPYLLRYLRGLVFVNPYGPARPVIETMLELNMRQGPFGLWSAWAGTRLIAEDFLSRSKRRAFNAQLKNIDKPTLITWGLHDGLLPVRNAHIGRENIPGARLKIFKRSAHSPMLEEPDDFNELIIQFLQDT